MKCRWFVFHRIEKRLRKSLAYKKLHSFYFFFILGFLLESRLKVSQVIDSKKLFSQFLMSLTALSVIFFFNFIIFFKLLTKTNLNYISYMISYITFGILHLKAKLDTIFYIFNVTNLIFKKIYYKIN